MSHPTSDKLLRMIYREFLLEPQLLHEVGLERLPSSLASLLGCGEQEAMSKLIQSPLLEAVSLDQLRSLMIIRDMSLVSRTAAALSAELKRPEITYEHCCRMALCYAVIGSQGHVFGALRAAAAKNDRWARHHYIYGLILGLQQNDVDRARWELGMALQHEPYEEGRARIRLALDIVDGKLE